MKNKKYIILAFVGIFLWLIETAYFGWNKKPESGAETFLGVVSWVFILWGVIGDIAINLKIEKSDIINCEKVEYKDFRQAN